MAVSLRSKLRLRLQLNRRGDRPKQIEYWKTFSGRLNKDTQSVKKKYFLEIKNFHTKKFISLWTQLAFYIRFSATTKMKYQQLLSSADDGNACIHNHLQNDAQRAEHSTAAE